MRYVDAPSFRQALEQRLKLDAAGDGARLARNRKRVVFDRLLARLAVTAPDRWVLKGGYALDLRLRGSARTTKDVDLDCDRGEGSQRFFVSVSLAGREFETFPLDVAVRPDPIIAFDTLTTADLLGFAGLAPVQVPAVRLERQVAEKLHAYTRTYDGDRHSSRTRDLVDIVLIADLAPLDAGALHEAIEMTFTTRGTHSIPRAVPAPPPEWTSPFRDLAGAVGMPPISQPLTPLPSNCWDR